ncbi:DUF6356 family protein [Pelagerythrobacter sp.]|uniref:DUF6356 family protein n=1 Tax=Pelagerythrobacter sp. TaxID=2800702 RepID=UPI0035B43B95
MTSEQTLSDRPQEAGAPARGSGILRRAFVDHPRLVGEGYLEHAGIAARFGGKMVAGGIKCLAHAVVPGMFERAASDCVRELHRELEQRRQAAAHTDPDYVI